jgi:macrolide resistance protein
VVGVSHKVPVYGVLMAGGFSALGNSVAGVTLPWFVLEITQSVIWTSAAAAAGMIPLIIGALYGGALIEKIGSRRVALIGDLIGATCVGSIALFHSIGYLSLAILFALIALGALLDGPSTTAQESRYPELARLAKLKLERVTALDELIDNGAMIGGPILAGVAIAAAGSTAALAVTAGCSIVGALINFFVLPRDRSFKRRAAATSTNDVWTGAKFLFGNPALRTLLILGMGVMAIFGALDSVVLPVIIKQGGRNVVELSWFLAAAGGGAIATALGFAAFGQALNKRLLIVACLACEGIAMLVLAAYPSGIMLLVSGALAGLGAGPLGPLINTVLLKSAPANIRSRVLGASTAVALVATPLAVMLAGALLELVGTNALLVSGSSFFALLTLIAAIIPSLRKLN